MKLSLIKFKLMIKNMTNIILCKSKLPAIKSEEPSSA